jgi:hypothetical protein
LNWLKRFFVPRIPPNIKTIQKINLALIGAVTVSALVARHSVGPLHEYSNIASIVFAILLGLGFIIQKI